ncbi:hypothetical protein [uncultured Desulfobacter sp.]|uniref:hypothetical protein n=1 Tax=uncultured Desulfobacter sp. TaxID=240139 RepID=UPI0029F47DC0|nr:hypothetical protein [uncultured Desulfobacter sp.]
MIYAIFRKEFFKIRVMWLLVFIANLCLLIHIWISTRRLFALDHAEVVWYRVLQLGQIHFEHLKFAPVLSGVLIACFQFLPEMWGERFRLSLHLPASAGFVAMGHLLAGIFAYSLVALADLLGIWLITSIYFPAQGIMVSLLTALPWIMAGICAYLGMALTLLEPDFRLKAVNLALTAGMVGCYLINTRPGAFGPSLPVLIVPLALMVPAVMVPVFRFRYRRMG